MDRLNIQHLPESCVVVQQVSIGMVATVKDVHPVQHVMVQIKQVVTQVILQIPILPALCIVAIARVNIGVIGGEIVEVVHPVRHVME